MIEFQINQILSVRLEGRNVKIYIQEKEFYVCSELIQNTKFNVEQFDSIDNLLEQKQDSNVNLVLYPEDEFWGVCSNLQAWYENDYNSELLPMNIAFPLLFELSQTGDDLAFKKFREEVSKRFSSGYSPVIDYLIEENYIFYIELNDFKSFIQNFTSELRLMIKAKLIEKFLKRTKKYRTQIILFLKSFLPVSEVESFLQDQIKIKLTRRNLDPIVIAAFIILLSIFTSGLFDSPYRFKPEFIITLSFLIGFIILAPISYYFQLIELKKLKKIYNEIFKSKY